MNIIGLNFTEQTITVITELLDNSRYDPILIMTILSSISDDDVLKEIITKLPWCAQMLIDFNSKLPISKPYLLLLIFNNAIENEDYDLANRIIAYEIKNKLDTIFYDILRAPIGKLLKLAKHINVVNLLLCKFNYYIGKKDIDKIDMIFNDKIKVLGHLITELHPIAATKLYNTQITPSFRFALDEYFHGKLDISVCKTLEIYMYVNMYGIDVEKYINNDIYKSGIYTVVPPAINPNKNYEKYCEHIDSLIKKRLPSRRLKNRLVITTPTVSKAVTEKRDLEILKQIIETADLRVEPLTKKKKY